jgi:hypothetical protein
MLVRQALHYLSHSPNPVFMLGFFKIGSHELFAETWFCTEILLMSASPVARIIGVSHLCLALTGFFALIISVTQRANSGL